MGSRVAVRPRNFSVDISGHHSLCELNFHRFLKLMPGFDDGRRNWSFSAGSGTGTSSDWQIDVTVVDVAPYTTTVDVVQTQSQSDYLTPARMQVRLYHDVAMAEVVGWNRHRHWLPKYDYPNKHMYHPDEKLSLNRFLGDWLHFCRTHGLVGSGASCDREL